MNNDTANQMGQSDALGLTIAWHPDLARIGDWAALSAGGRLSRLEPLFAGDDGERALDDPSVSRRPFEFVIGGDGSIELRGDFETSDVRVGDVPVTGSRVFSDVEIARGVCITVSARVVLVLRLGPVPSGVGRRHQLSGDSRAMATIAQDIDNAALSESPLLIRGPSGSGKERVARAIHRESVRAGGEFVSVNLRSGANPFAGDPLAPIERAIGGTLFLNHVDEATNELQAELLRALESGVVATDMVEEPSSPSMGEAKTVRLIVAAESDLEQAVAEQRFRPPLLHRLSIQGIGLPALRDRREDISGLLVHFLMREFNVADRVEHLAPREPDAPLWLSADQCVRLLEHRWPGNVRQLRRVAHELVSSCGELKNVDDSELTRILRV